MSTPPESRQPVPPSAHVCRLPLHWLDALNAGFSLERYYCGARSHKVEPGEGGGGEGGETIPNIALSPANSFCTQMGSDDYLSAAHLSVLLIVRGKVTRQCPQTTTIEENGEPKRGIERTPPSAYHPNAVLHR